MANRAVAIAGSGDLARYLAEEFVRYGKHDVHLISRSERPWFSELGSTSPSIRFHQVKDYTCNNLLPLMDKFGIGSVVSAIGTDDPASFLGIHQAILDACRQSRTCKRLIPSDYGGNSEHFPETPIPYASTRTVFRRILAAQDDIEWTSVNGGWMADYFVRFPSGCKTYIKPFSPFSLDFAKKEALIPGTGETNVTFTCARDVSKAVVRLIDLPKWEPYVYVNGETTTWLELLPKVEALLGYKFQRRFLPREEIWAMMSDSSDINRMNDGYIHDFTVCGAGAVPQDTAERQKREYFSDIHFRPIEELIKEAQTGLFI